MFFNHLNNFERFLKQMYHTLLVPMGYNYIFVYNKYSKKNILHLYYTDKISLTSKKQNLEYSLMLRPKRILHTYDKTEH